MVNDSLFVRKYVQLRSNGCGRILGVCWKRKYLKIFIRNIKYMVCSKWHIYSNYFIFFLKYNLIYNIIVRENTLFAVLFIYFFLLHNINIFIFFLHFFYTRIYFLNFLLFNIIFFCNISFAVFRKVLHLSIIYFLTAPCCNTLTLFSCFPTCLH